METFPKIISVDDHTVEPPNVWRDRLPSKYHDIGPRVVRAPLKEMTFVGGKFAPKMGAAGDDGPIADWWVYEDLHRPLTRLDTAVGYSRDDIKLEGITYEQMRPGSFSVPERLADMDVNHVQSALCFPTFPRFCGQTFTEAKDRELGLLGVRAYNDWMVEEWCGGSGGRLIPLCIIPLWDIGLAVAEIRRNAARGVRAVTFSEIPTYLGLPSIHSGYWDPFFAVCQETGTVVNMHIGSSSQMPAASPDAPPAVQAALSFNNAMASMMDFLFSGVLVKFPRLKLAYSEGQMGWIPYALERADDVWEEHRAWGGVRDLIPEPPSAYYYRQIFCCFFRDKHGVASLDKVGRDNATFETDYPHVDSTFPHTKEVALDHVQGLDDETVHKLMRGNAIRMLGLDLDK